MLRVVSDGLWTEIRKLGRAPGSRFAAIAYVTSDDFLKFKRGDTLVCDASDDAISSGQTSAGVLEAALRRGVRLYSSPGLHAKALVLGRVAVVGSANMSSSSATRLDEAAVITDDVRAVTAVRVFVQRLTEGGDCIDEKFIDRISKIKVTPRRMAGQRRRAIKLRGPRAWLVSVVPIREDRPRSEVDFVQNERQEAEKEAKFTDSDAGYARWTGTSEFRKHAKPGDSVITMWRSTWSAKRGKVYAPEPILHREDAYDATHFFIEEYVDREATSIPFSAFQNIWRRAGAGTPPGTKSIREISPEILEKLRAGWSSK